MEVEGPSHKSAADQTFHSIQQSFIQELSQSSDKQGVQFPDGRTAHVIEVSNLRSNSPQVNRRRWKLQLEDEQTVYVCLDVKTPPPQLQRVQRDSYGTFEFERVGFRIWVNDLEKARHFYSHLLRLPLSKESTVGFTVAAILTVQKNKDSETPQLSFVSQDKFPSVFLKYRGLDALYEHLQRSNVEIVRSIYASKAGQRFQVRDPEGHVVEFFEGSISES